VSVSAASIAAARRAPWLLVGWTWFVVMLVPVIGLAKVGQHASADRFTYLPSIGLLVAAVWSVHALARERNRLRLATIAAAAVLVALVLATRRQLEFWRDDLTLWTRALSVTRDNCIAHGNLGSALLARGDARSARSHFDEAIRACPHYAKAHANLGIVLDGAGDAEGAIAQFSEAVRLDPTDPVAWYDRGVALAKVGRLDAALASYETAVRLDQESVDAHANLAGTLARLGRPEAAAAEYRVALQLAPERDDVRARLDALARGGP